MKYNIIWATIRPDNFIKCFDDWYEKCEDKSNIFLYLALSREGHVETIKKYLQSKMDKEKVKLILTSPNIVGVTYPTYMLCRYLTINTCKDDDIIILSSDDFFPPDKWDKILKEEFQNYSGCLIFNDLNQNAHPHGMVVQIPIMDYKTLKSLNNVIYNPSFNHFSSDNELYDNLVELNKVKDLSIEKSNIIFEHRHYTVGKRNLDEFDDLVRQRVFIDRDNYFKRKSLNVYQKTNQISNINYLIRKRIISFSLYGNNPMYVNGALENVKLQKIYYPGWTCRFYVDDTLDKGIVAQLNYFGCEVVNKGFSDGNIGAYWRFEVLCDNDVEIAIIRDCDSRLNLKEAHAVNEWLESGKSFHIMRDHPRGHNSEIMAGMFGARIGFMKDFREKYDKWIQSYQPYTHPESVNKGKYFYGDTYFLNNIIWPVIKEDHMAHDVYFNFSKDAKKFKINIDPLFIGQRFDQNNTPLYE